ncbi:unnamed protein product [Caenorhabditis nigoni]|uniref:BTB domain-containing protein n=1 Tax=Caenorhabditis nigoni TaxID=1611254 RepID=A0A2G5VB17_9PELO|nr:hypothetical protein B9Z55_007757 [Caenorhabditis nigoni]
MANNKENDMKIEKESESDEMSKINQVIEKLKITMTAEIEEMKKDHERKFDEILDKFQSIPSIPNSNKDSKECSKTKINDTIPFPLVTSENTYRWSSESVKNFKLNHVFKNVLNFKENVCNYSEWENHFNANWLISVKRYKNHLGFFIHCKTIDPPARWAIRAQLEFKLVGINQNESGELYACYDNDLGRGYNQFVPWKKVKNEYLVDGNLKVEGHVSILETSGLGKEKIRKFDESQKETSDVILVVRYTKFYVLKMYLAAQSSFFKTLFLGNFSESNKSVITLTGIDPDDFHRFLEVLYGESAICDFSVEGILLVADMYDTPTVVRKCEEFLVEKSEKSSKKLFEMALRYNFESLKKKCVSGIKTFADFQSILPEDIQSLSHSMMAELLQKSRTL